MSASISVRADGVGVISLNSPPVNSLGQSLKDSFCKEFPKLVSDPQVKAICVTGSGRFFSGGFDIAEFSVITAGGREQYKDVLGEMLNMIDSCPKTIVAAINGPALGGGFEVALACHYRVASDKAQVAFPEVTLGLLPGGQGSQRLPRLVPLEDAARMMLTGSNVRAEPAQKLGILDAIAGEDVIEAAAKWALSKPPAPVSRRSVPAASISGVAGGALDKLLKQAQAQMPGAIAPESIVTCIKAACSSMTFEEGLKVEMQEFVKLLFSPQSIALRYLFFAERACAKVPGLNEKPGPLAKIGIVGAGLMGGGIAMSSAEAGMNVVLLDVSQQAVDRGMDIIRKNYARSVDRKSKTQAQVDKTLAAIVPSLNYSDLRDCDLVVEAVFENMKVKQDIFKKLDEVCKPGCVLASNTSFLSIDEIASATKRPQDVIGCHFFSPANVMRLLENVRGSKSSPRTIATAMAFGAKIKKVTCLVGNCPGFVANRVMGKSGADWLLQNGALPHQVDAACEAFGMKMGPFRMADLVGLDLFGRERVQSKVAEPEKVVRDALYAAERFGQKNGKGFYRYDAKRQWSIDPEAEAIIGKVWKNTGKAPASFSQEEIVETCYFPVINEGFKCLEEGIAIRPGDIDMCLVYGYNWPRLTGGPMHFASQVGLQKVKSSLEKLGQKPAKLLEECVANGWTLDSEALQARLERGLSKL